MELNTIMKLILILTCINIVFVGLGLFTEQDLYRMSILSNDVQTMIDTGQTTTNDINISSNSTGSDSLTSLAPIDSNSLSTKYSTIKTLVLGILIGYVAVLNAVGLPVLLVWLIACIIGIFQAFAIFYLIIYLISSFAGGL